MPAPKRPPFKIERGGDDAGDVTMKLAASFGLKTGQASEVIDAIRNELRRDPSGKSLKAAIGIAPIDAEKFAPAVDALNRVLSTIRSR